METIKKRKIILCDDEDMNDLEYLHQMQVSFEEDDEIDLLCGSAAAYKIYRNSPLYRKRWDSEYLLDVAKKEGSFISEYRVDPGGFDALIQLLEPVLEKNQSMASRAMSKCGSGPITTASRVGCGLIMLGGGRSIECMRTHGMSKPVVYTNLHEVVDAINSHPALAIECDNSPGGLQERADDFCKRSEHSLFKFCTAAVDGLAIHIKAPDKKQYVKFG
jgi:hypothetical protein